MNNNAVNTSTVTLNGEQARRELNVLTDKAEKLKVALIAASKVPPSPEATKEYNKLEKQLKQTEKAIRDQTKAQWDIKKVLDNISGATMRDLIKAQKQLNAEINSGKIERGTEAWKHHQNQLKAVKAEIALVNNETKVGQSNFMRFAEFTNQTWQLFAVAAMAVTGVITVLKKYMDMRNELEDQNANLKALTGLEDKDITKLQKYAEAMASNPLEGTSIRIRSSVIEIMEAYKLVGSAKPELLKDADALNEVTKQSMILAAAASMPLADAVHGTVIALNQYGAAAESANRFVNALGAGAKFGAVEVPYIAEALTKFGALAKDANVPIEQSIALIEVLGAKGFQAEVAGTGMKQFFVKTMTGARDTNPAVVGMANALDNLNKKFSGPGGFNKMVDMFGEREVVIARSLIANRDQFKSLAKEVTGTNTAMQQASTTSATVNAKIAQSSNQLNILAMQLVSNVSPAFLKLVNVTTQLVRFFVQLPEFIRENKTLLISIAGVMAIYTGQLILNYAISKKIAIQNAISLTLSKAKTAALLIECAVTQLFAGNLNTAAKAMKALNAQMFLNPYVAVLAGIALLTVGVYSWVTSLTAAQKAYRKFNEEVAVETTTANQMFEALKIAKQGTQERKDLIEQINTTYGQYFTNQLTEVSNLNQINEAQKLVNDSLTKNIAMKIKAEAKEKVIRDFTPLMTDKSSEVKSSIENIKGKELGNIISNKVLSIAKYNSGDLIKAKALINEYLKSSLGNDFDVAIQVAVQGVAFYKNKMDKGITDIDNQFADIVPEKSNTMSLKNTYAENLAIYKKNADDKRNAVKLAHDNGTKTEKDYQADLIAIENDYQRWLQAAKGNEIKTLEAKAKAAKAIIDKAISDNKIMDFYRKGLLPGQEVEMADANKEILENNQLIKQNSALYKTLRQEAINLKNEKETVWVKPDTSMYEDADAAKAAKAGGSGTKVDPHKAGLDAIDLIFAEKMAILKKNRISEFSSEEQFAKDLLKLNLDTLKQKQALYFGGNQKEMLEVDKWEIAEKKKLKTQKLEKKEYFDALNKIETEANTKRTALNKNVDKEYWDYQNQINDLKLKSNEDAEKLKYDALIKGQEARILAETQYENLMRQTYADKLEEDPSLQNEYDNKMLALEQAMAESRLINAQIFQDAFNAIEFNSDEERLKAEIVVNKEIEDAQIALGNAKKKIRLKLAKEEKDDARKLAQDKKDIQKEIEDIEKNLGISDRQTKHKEYKDGLALLKTKYEEEQKLLKDDLVAKAAATKKYETDKARIAVKQLELAAEAGVQIASAASELMTKIQEAETLAVDNKYAAQLKAAKVAGEDTTALESQIEEEKKGIKKKYADIDFAITSAKIISSTALGIVKALEEFPGPVGIALGVLMGATGLAELAVANQQRLSVQQLWTGGFTNPGDKYKPAGIVHAGEFVANQEAVNHSPMRKVFNLVDHAQRTNSVARITNDDIIRSLSVRAGYANGGFVGGSSVTNNNGISTAQLIAAIQTATAQSTAVNAALLTEIQKGIKANVSASGKNGVVEAVSIYNKLIENAGR